MKTKKQKESDLKYLLDDLMASGNQDGAVLSVELSKDEKSCVVRFLVEEVDGQVMFIGP